MSVVFLGSKFLSKADLTTFTKDAVCIWCLHSQVMFREGKWKSSLVGGQC